MKSRYLFLLGVALCSLLTAATNPVLAQGTAFTYSGVLNHNGAPVNGAYDLRFTLYDANALGNLVAGPLSVNAVGVTNGLFAARIDFGVGVFTGLPRWLSVEVQPTGGGGFVPLTPWQEITSSPYAIRAATAGTATSVANGAVVKSLNNLHDDLTLAAGANVTITPSGNTLTLAAAGVGGSGIWSVLNNNAYYLAGGVGIGTNSPAPGVRLEVNGTTKMNGGGSGGYVYMHTPSGESGMSIIGANRADVRFDGYTLKLLAGFGPGAMPSENGIAVNTLGNVGIGTMNPSAKLDVRGTIEVDQGINVYGGAFFEGNVNINGIARGDVTMLLQARAGDSFPVLVWDSIGNDLFYLDQGHKLLSMSGNAQKSSGGTSWLTFSDRRFKQDVRAYEPGLKEVLQLRTVRFHYRDDPKRGLTSTHEEVGFIAQEVREVIPEAVTEDKDGYLSLKADPIHWAAINAIQELNAKLEKQRAENAELKQRLEKLEQRLDLPHGGVN